MEQTATAINDAAHAPVLSLAAACQNYETNPSAANNNDSAKRTHSQNRTPLAETRVWTSPPETTTGISPSTWLSSTARWACGYFYDKTAVDRLVGLDFFGARYFSGAQGRFTSRDPTPNGISVRDPQSWNLYSYVRNRPTRFVDVNGQWATALHGDLVTAALSGYISAGALKALIQQQYVMDADQSPTGQYKHFMSGGEAPAVAAQNAWSFVRSEMTIAQQNTLRNGIFQPARLEALGDLIHTVQDFTSPMHTTADGTPMVWNGGYWPPSKWGPGLQHVAGESSPHNDWSRIGEAIRLTMAAFMQASPKLAAQGGLTPARFNREAEKRITDYVNKMWTPNPWGNPAAEEAARQCALGNPAACGAYQDMDLTTHRR